MATALACLTKGEISLTPRLLVKRFPVLVCVLAIVMGAAGALLQESATAHPCDPGKTEEAHVDLHETLCTAEEHDSPHGVSIRVHGGRDQEIRLNVFPPLPGPGEMESRYLGEDDQIEVKLEGFDLSNRGIGDDPTLLMITDDVDDPGLPVKEVEVDPAEGTLTLILPRELQEHGHGAGTHLLIVIAQGTGILAPRIPMGFEEQDTCGDAYEVEITLVDTGSADGTGRVPVVDENCVVVRNPVSSTVPGEAVRVELHTHSNDEIHSNEEIVVDFSGPTDDASFNVPETIDQKNVQIGHGGRTHNPSSVVVQGKRVVLTVPADGSDSLEIQGDYTITFNQSAGIKNPLTSGNRIISVSSLAHGEDVDEITAVIRRTTTVDPEEGTRGSTFTLEGRGYADGTVTVFDGDDEIIDAGELLGSVNTTRGSFDLDLTARGDQGRPTYQIWTLDSNGVPHHVDFLIRSAMSFEPDRVSAGSGLKISVRDWDGTITGLAAVSVGGRTAFAAETVQFGSCYDFESGPRGLRRPDGDGVVTLEVLVPPGVPSGLQTVSVFGPEHVLLPRSDSAPGQIRHCADLGADESRGARVGDAVRKVEISDRHNPVASRTIEVTGRSLRVFPDSAARGQRITIVGSGIDRISGNGRDIEQVSIGGWEVDENPDRFEVPADGDFALTVTVPENAADGPNEVRVQGRDGTVAHGTITVPAPALTVRPEAGRRGSSVSVEGTGFIAGGLVSLFYGDGGDLASGDEHVDAVLADRKGSFTASITVPVDARLGTRHTVTALARTGGSDEVPVRAGASHSVPSGTLSAVQDTACPGDTLTILGENLPPFALVRSVRVGGVDVTPAPNPATDENGSFRAEVTVPHLEPGNQSVSVRVSNTVLVDVVEIVDTPLTGPPALVFKELIRAGVLGRVWHFQSSTQTWSFFDPDPMFAGFNNLNEVGTEDILWVHLNRGHDFQGETLASGWNAVQLD